MLKIEEIVAKTTDLPSFPKAALQVIAETESSTSSASALAFALAQDQSLSVRVLRLANSAYYGLSRQVSDLQEAVVVLGVRSVKNLALVAITYPLMNRSLDGYCLGPKQMWVHSFGTGVAAQMIAKHSGVPNDDLAFTAGLLHDVGKLALSVWLENRIAPMIALAKKEDLAFDEAERKILGYDHAQVGEYLAESWKLPRRLIDPIRFHHDPNSCSPHNKIVDCVHFADFLTMTLGYGLGGDGLQYKIQEEPMLRLGLTPRILDELTEQFVEVYAQYDSMFEELAAA